MSNKTDALFYLRNKTSSIKYDKNRSKLSKTIDLIFTYFVGLLPVIGVIVLFFVFMLNG